MCAMTPDLYRVESVSSETHDTYTLNLKPAGNGNGGGAGMRFSAGQFNMLYVFGKGEVPISISGDPTNGDPLIHTIRSVGAVTAALTSVEAGELVGVRGPLGTSWPLEQAKGKDVVIVAGGIGLAPLRPAIYAILADRDSYGRFTLLYGSRTPKDLLFRDELEAWRARSDFDVEVTVDAADSTNDDWRGRVGVVPSLIPEAKFDSDDTIVMICGPEIMMRYTVPPLLDRGLDEKDIFVSMERNHNCGIAQCGHCQIGPFFVCKDGPVFSYDVIKPWVGKREI